MQRVTPRIVWIGLSLPLAACSGASGHRVVHDQSIVHRQQREEAEATPRRGERVAAIARKYLGVRYQWGGASPSGFDCSGFVRYVYQQVGVSLPHNAAQQYTLGTPVSRDSLEPGDLVFFDRLRHSGIYIGLGRFIHARRSGIRVSISHLDEDWYTGRWVGARRL